ncbi:unnamed protein product [Allacma fusca]|uniref:DNA-directed RNA polymerase subunit n=1 Tax=Allacma fusca TaxID=39272 RepID=A0A8J2PDX5_9HEXA|nr:unnamed protein product [Allacma fusca]
MTSITEIFAPTAEFCSLCGSILPVRTGSASDNHCMVCKVPISRDHDAEAESGILETVSYVIHFNDRDKYSKLKSLSGDASKKSKKPAAEGPLVNRDCKQCGNKKMSYMTLQLRSADEGQTVFFTCPKCRFKESENS